MLKPPKACANSISLLALTFILLSLAFPVSADGNIVYVSDRTLNLRTGPGLNFPSVAELYPGEPLTVISKDGFWLSVKRAGGQSGWVNGAYVGPTLPISAIVQYKTVIVDTGKLNLRSGPGLNYSSIAEIPEGETLNVIARSGLWINVQRANSSMTGWVNKTYTRPVGVAASVPQPAVTAQPSSSAPSTGSFAVVNSAFVNLRSGSGFEFDTLAEMPYGEVLTVIGRSGAWINVRRSNGQEGWSSSAVLKLSGTAPTIASSSTLSPTKPSPSSSPSPTPTPTATLPVSNAFCREGNVLAGVHDPERLQVLKPCLTVTGVVTEISTSDDGDLTFRLRLNSSYIWTLNDVNRSRLRGYLQVEIIPVDQDLVAAPAIGDRVSVTGAYVTDTVHGWNEIHPVWQIDFVP